MCEKLQKYPEIEVTATVNLRRNADAMDANYSCNEMLEISERRQKIEIQKKSRWAELMRYC